MEDHPTFPEYWHVLQETKMQLFTSCLVKYNDIIMPYVENWIRTDLALSNMMIISAKCEIFP